MSETDDIQELVALFRDTMALFRENMFQFKSEMSRECGGIEITAPQGMLMGILGKYGQMKISDLSEKLGLTNSTVSGIVDRLEKPGIVERIRSLEDKRVVYVRLSEKFGDLHKGLQKSMEERMLSFMRKGTPEEIKKISEGMKMLKRLLTDQPARRS